MINTLVDRKLSSVSICPWFSSCLPLPASLFLVSFLPRSPLLSLASAPSQAPVTSVFLLSQTLAPTPRLSRSSSGSSQINSTFPSPSISLLLNLSSPVFPISFIYLLHPSKPPHSLPLLGYLSLLYQSCPISCQPVNTVFQMHRFENSGLVMNTREFYLEEQFRTLLFMMSLQTPNTIERL